MYISLFQNFFYLDACAKRHLAFMIAWFARGLLFTANCLALAMQTVFLTYKDVYMPERLLDLICFYKDVFRYKYFSLFRGFVQIFISQEVQFRVKQKS